MRVNPHAPSAAPYWSGTVSVTLRAAAAVIDAAAIVHHARKKNNT